MYPGFLVAVVCGDGPISRAKAEMIRCQVDVDTPPQFPTLTAQKTDANRSIRLVTASYCFINVRDAKFI